ncbi:MAG: tetratricopeptide repeat protein [Steroidobacteraceae bacterium]
MWSRRCSEWGVLIGLGLLEAACSTSHVARTPTPVAPAPVAVAAGKPPPLGAAAVTAPAAGSSAQAPVATPVAAPPAPPPARATADFARAVGLAKAGKDDEAELEFEVIATGYPSYPGALVNLGILYRKHAELAKSDQSLHAAVQRDPNDAEGWSELGVTLRQEGKFHEAADAYNQAISVNPNFAPAYRNLAIVLDLYLGDTAAALTAMEHYKDLAADDKGVAGWIADLKQRAGKSAAPAPDKAGG